MAAEPGPGHGTPLACGATWIHVQSVSLYWVGLGSRQVGAQWAVLCPRLAPLHQLLQPMASCARVVQCAQAVPTLHQAFFSAVTEVSLPPRSSTRQRGHPERGPWPHP